MDSWIASVRLLLCIFLHHPSYRHLIWFLLCNCLGKMTRSQDRCMFKKFLHLFSKWLQRFMFPLAVSEGSKKFQHWLKNLRNFRHSDPFTTVRGPHILAGPQLLQTVPLALFPIGSFGLKIYQLCSLLCIYMREKMVPIL